MANAFQFRVTWLAALAIAVFASPAAAALKVITSTEDLASLTREVGGDKVTVEALARGYQDPHYVEPKPSFILKLHAADLLVVVGRELEIGWLPPLIQQSRNGNIQPGAKGYLDASMNVRILEIPTGQITRAMGDVHPPRQPALLARSGERPPHREDHPAETVRAVSGRQRGVRKELYGLRPPPERSRETLGRDDGPVQRDQGRHVSSVLAQLCRAVRPQRHRLRRAETGYSAVARPIPWIWSRR